jgi:hypothetical protein
MISGADSDLRIDLLILCADSDLRIDLPISGADSDLGTEEGAAPARPWYAGTGRGEYSTPREGERESDSERAREHGSLSLYGRESASVCLCRTRRVYIRRIFINALVMYVCLCRPRRVYIAAQRVSDSAQRTCKLMQEPERESERAPSGGERRRRRRGVWGVDLGRSC